MVTGQGITSQKGLVLEYRREEKLPPCYIHTHSNNHCTTRVHIHVFLPNLDDDDDDDEHVIQLMVSRIYQYPHISGRLASYLRSISISIVYHVSLIGLEQ